MNHTRLSMSSCGLAPEKIWQVTNSAELLQFGMQKKNMMLFCPFSVSLPGHLSLSPRHFMIAVAEVIFASQLRKKRKN